ncbi:hypothetical protein [Nocardia sp. alder85J]|uniref:hypothetical protein n=1 Tax=Nocardia sp. alder85J TaxID=2862949 RepID=UPI001CD57C18|nr:hypothetical protein [Nocardia sp. alder85J]MCX4096359.1 hypothetical protein [Nocardia sp. alder85J]
MTTASMPGGSVEVEVRDGPDGTVIVAPPGIATVADGSSAMDTLVLAVTGGYLSWNLLSGSRIPAAVLDEPESAQQWIWAVYGEDVALAVDDFAGATLRSAVRPGLPALAAAAWRLGYAHWAARWWPASAIDSIAALDDRLLAAEIATLTGECESLVDGADALADADAGEFAAAFATARAEDYALAAGDTDAAAGDAAVLGRGVGGWDWHRCPPGLLDASERAVSWEVVRAAGATTVRVRAVAAPGFRGPVPEYLRPVATVRFAGATATTPLVLTGDHWHGLMPLPDRTGPAALPDSADSRTPPYSPTPTAGSGPATPAAASGPDSSPIVAVQVPGIGPADSISEATLRQRIRDFAADRLRRAARADDDPYDAPLLAEIAAAEMDF